MELKRCLHISLRFSASLFQTLTCWDLRISPLVYSPRSCPQDICRPLLSSCNFWGFCLHLLFLVTSCLPCPPSSFLLCCWTVQITCVPRLLVHLPRSWPHASSLIRIWIGMLASAFFLSLWLSHSSRSLIFLGICNPSLDVERRWNLSKERKLFVDKAKARKEKTLSVY